MRERQRLFWIGLALALVCAAAPERALALTAQDEPGSLTLRDHGRTVVIEKAPWRLSVREEGGRVLAAEAAATAVEEIPNADRSAFADIVGDTDIAYPGLPTVSYQPLAYRRAGTWRHVAALRTSALRDGAAELDVATSDGGTGRVTVAIEPDGAVRVAFRPPPGEAVEAVADAFVAPVGERYLGGGQRFGAIDQRGRSVPLWVSHGPGSDRFGSTNEIAVPFLLSTGGWALGLESAARGELNVAVPGERPDLLNAVIEAPELELRLYTGSPPEMLSAYTQRSGRPSPPPAAWAYEPAYWMDEGNTQAAIEAYVDRLGREDLAAGAFWIDNPWEAHKGDFGPDPKRFPSFDAMVARLRDRGVHVVAWASPFVDKDSALGPAVNAGGHLVEGTGADDATYVPPRGLDPHLDFTDRPGVDLYEAAAARLLARGVDGFKADRSEEDLGDASRWADGAPNRLQHNLYPVRYQAALRAACVRAGKADCFIIARGGAAGSQRHAAAWAGDNLSAPGAAGLGQALRSLLSLSLSGQPISGSDIGGYTGTRSDAGDGFPTKELFIRWTQLGALSPIMQTLYAPWEFDAETVAVFRRYAAFHAALAPTLARWGREAAGTGVPIVRPLPYAFGGDASAAQVDDEYLLGPDLLVAPVTETGQGNESRTVYLPEGRWRDVWSGAVTAGPQTLVVAPPLDQIPLYVREGGSFPKEALDALKDPRGRGPRPGAGVGPGAAGSPCRDRLAPRSRLTRRSRTALRGRAGDRGCRATGVRRVQVAVQRRAGRRCRSLGPAGRFGRPAPCRRLRFLRARGRTTWVLPLRRPLPAGRYRISIRATDRAGNRDRRGRVVALTVRARAVRSAR